MSQYTRTSFAALNALILLASSVSAQDLSTGTDAEPDGGSAVSLVETILSGEDGDATYAALAGALGADASGADPVARIATTRQAESAGSQEPVTTRLSGRFGDVWASAQELSPETLSAILGAGVVLLLLLGVWTLVRTLGRLRRARGARPSRRRRSRSRSKVVCRDAARLEARLRTRRAA